MGGRGALIGSRRNSTAATNIAAVAVSLVVAASVSPAEGVEQAEEVARRAPSEFSPRGGLAWRNYFPNVELTTHNSDQVRFYDDLIKGKVVVINFMYATCTET
jgi:cytochrome oxidase Cu insertion factor (SCO1/SenC/PrrC family)